MMNKRVMLSILLLFAVVFVLFMFSVLSVNFLSASEGNQRDSAVSAVTGETALTADDFAADNAANDESANPLALLITDSTDDLAVFTQWCTYNKYRYLSYNSWPDASDLSGAAVVIVGQMAYETDAADTLLTYTQTGIPLLFTRLPEYETLAASTALRDIFGIEACVSPAYTADGLKLFADFFISSERIYTEGDFYGEKDDTQFTLPYYTLRAGYEGYMVGLLDNQTDLGIENQQLPTLLWRSFTGNSQVFVVNTDLFSGQGMLGVITAFLSQADSWYLYPVVNARTILMTDFPFLSYENSKDIQQLYSRDTPGFQRDIIWPNVVKIFRNYGAVANFFVSPQLDYADGEAASADDLALYLELIKGQSGAIGLSFSQVSDLAIEDVASAAISFFSEHLPSFRFYTAFAGQFSYAQWQAFLEGEQADILDALSLVLFPNSDDSPLLQFLTEDVLTVQITADGYAHETLDDLQLISLMTALGYAAQQVDMTRALLPQDDEDDWGNLSELWSKGDTFYRDFEDFESTSVYELETRARRLLGMNFLCKRSGDTLTLTLSPLDEEQWFVLRLQSETVVSVSGGEAAQISDTAWLVHVTQENVAITLQPLHSLATPQ